MKRYDYLIVGGGLAADAAAKGIRELDATGSIALISNEPHPPYQRPNLSKKLWTGKPLEKIWCHTENTKADLFLGRSVVDIDADKKRVLDETGDSYTYGKLLLATGGNPIQLPFGKDQILYFRYLDDYLKLKELSTKKKSFIIIGGGFIGSELAAALHTTEAEITMIFPEKGIGARVFPENLSIYITEYYRKKGVNIINEASVSDIKEEQGGTAVYLDSGQKLIADVVVAGIGIRPNTTLAQHIGLEIDNGIVVDRFLSTSHPDTYAAGDNANFYHASLKRHIRVEHEDNAIAMGRQAGRNMAGALEAYDHIPMFYSDLFDLGYEAVGGLDSGLEVKTDWKKEYEKGVLYYKNKSEVEGVLLWNTWDAVDKARQLLLSQQPELTLT